MAINFDDSHEVSENGIAFTDSGGNAKLYITSGVGVPTGNAAPINSWYFREDEDQLWRKIGSGDNDWEEFTSAVAEAVEFESYTDEAVSSTTSNDWVTKLDIQTTLKDAGSYLLLHSGQVTNSNNNREVGYRVQWKPDNSGTWITLIDNIFEIARGESYIPVTAVNIVSLVSSDQIDFRIQWGQTDGGGTGRIKDTSVTAIKVEEII